MKICERAINAMQVRWPKGKTILCQWSKAKVGNALEQTIPEMRRSETTRRIWENMLKGDYSCCHFERAYCPYYTNRTLDKHMVEVESVDDIPEYPHSLFLAYETNCNYDCTCCNFHRGGKGRLPVQSPEELDKITDHLREALPHIKTIGASGTAELFCSPHILQLLREWKPLAPARECSAALETNGSLFNLENWKKIENLGQYGLRVYITVMSLQEDRYQHLSGTKLPLSNIIENLRFVKSLREQGIINYLELSTVIQEENFREVPEMADRFLNEFGADRFRFRPLFPGGIYDDNIQWFMDVRNPYHPYFDQYMKMTEHPIFSDPRVWRWTGNHLSNRGPHPGVIANKKLTAISKLLSNSELLTDTLKNKKAAVYNMGAVGKMIVYQYGRKTDIVCCYSAQTNEKEYEGVPIIPFDKESGGSEAPDVIVLTAYHDRDQAKDAIRARLGAEVEIVDIWEKLGLCER